MTESESTARVLFLTHNYPRHPEDFAGRFVARLAELIVARGPQVMVVAPHAAGCAMAEDDHGVHVHRFRYAADEDEVIAYWCARSGITYLGRADIGHDAGNKIVPFGAPA